MKFSTRHYKDGQMLFELPIPRTQPVYPSPSSGVLTEKEMLAWYSSILEFNLRHSLQGDQAARDWVSVSDVENPMSFINVCRFLGFNPERLRDALSERHTLGKLLPTLGKEFLDE